MRATKIILLLLIYITCLGCERNDEVTDENPAIPAWLQSKIAEIEDNIYYDGTLIIRHEWKSKYYYHINTPLSSCLYCEVYNHDGEKVDWKVESRDDYLKNRKNRVVIWKQKGKKQP